MFMAKVARNAPPSDFAENGIGTDSNCSDRAGLLTFMDFGPREHNKVMIGASPLETEKTVNAFEAGGHSMLKDVPIIAPVCQ